MRKADTSPKNLGYFIGRPRDERGAGYRKKMKEAS